MDGNLGNVLRQPSQNIKEWKQEDYINNIRYVASQWNKVVYEFSPADTSGSIIPKFWVQDYIQNASYFFGKNQSTDYGFATKDEINQKLPIPMFRGQDIYELIKHTVGVIGDFIRSASKILSCVSLGEGTTGKKQVLRDFAKFQADNNAQLQQLELYTGLKFEPFDGINFKSQQEVNKHFTNYLDTVEKIYLALAKYSFMFNYGAEFFEKGSEYYGIGGLVHARIYAHNGKPRWRLIEPQNAIWDNYNSLNQHREDRYGGEYCEKTIPEALSLWKWTSAEIEDLKALANASNSIWSTYNIPTGNNIVWWRTSSTGVPMVTCVHGEWRSSKFEGTETKIDEDGEPYECEIWTPCLRQGWLIGNKYLKEDGLSSNQMEDKEDKTRMRLSYVTATSDTVLGVSMGIAGRLKEYSKLKDYFQTKLNQLVANSKGKRYVMYSDKMPEGMRAPDILSQLSQAGIAVIPSRDADDDSLDGNRGLVETIDMTLDPSILGLAQLISNLRNYMDNIISLPANARGLNTNYQSKDALQMNITASGYGMSSYYNTFYTWVLRMLEYSADLAKVVMAESDDEMLRLLVGDASVELIKTKDLQTMQFEDFAMGLSVDDFISDNDRQVYIQYYIQKAAASNDPEDDRILVNLMNIKSHTAFREYIDSVVTAKLDRMTQEQQAAQQQATAASEQAAQAQIKSAEIQQETALALNDKQHKQNIESKIVDVDLAAQQPQ